MLKRICLLFIVLICEISVTSCNSREVTSVVDRTEMVNITFRGGSGKAHVESPVKVVTNNGTTYVTLVWSSKNYDYIIVDGNKYYNENEGGPSTFTIPVASLDEPLDFIGDTLAMSQPHEIEYTIIWNKSPEETDTETVDNSGRGFGIRPDEPPAITEINGIKETGRLELTHATGFDIRQFGQYRLISIYGVGDYLLVPEGESSPADVPKGVTVINMPVDHTYLVSTSAMDLVSSIGALDSIAFCSLSEDRWYIDAAKDRMKSGRMLYAGKYRMPDYELILSKGCDLAIENTMIFHDPEVKEKLEELGIPVIVETSSYESDPLGRLEWIKLYGTLFGKEKEADELYHRESSRIESVPAGTKPCTVAFFSVSATGMINVRRPNDYIAKMIGLAGCTYTPSSAGLEDEGSAGTFNMQAEDFYAQAREADILIYNSTIDGEISSVDDLIGKNPIFADFKAVKENRVYCLENGFFQKTTGMADFISDIRTIAEDGDECVFLTKLR
ncbi:MAG: ABC transporter substrate-binding protein [Lachnospiraceae bacterium]|nr:ABC transporter substrate-binding protein [Lachnospiraceae bacterium]